MPAIIDPDELGNAQSQLNGAASGSAQTGGAIIDPQELANAQTQLNAPSGQPAPASSAYDGPVMQPTPDRGVLGTVDDTVRMLTNKIPFADRFSAGMDTLLGTGLPGADYAKNLQNERWKDQALDAEHPFLAKALGTLGGGAAVVATAPADVLAPGATLAAKALAGAGTGAAYGGVQGASSAPDLTNLADTAQRAAEGAGVGAFTGAALPIMARGIGSVYEGAANLANGGTVGMSRAAAAPLLSAITAQGPQDVQSAVSRLGDQGMLADAGPALLGKAQGAALNSDQARQTLFDALNNRATGTIARINQDVNSALGPAQSPQQITDTVQQLRGYEHQALPGIFASAAPVDTMPILQQIDTSLQNAVGPERAALSKARSYLVRPGTDASGNPISIPIDNAQQLSNAKTALDGDIKYGDPSLGIPPGALAKANGATVGIRGAINGALRDQVPGYGDIMDKSAQLARHADAIEQGYNSVLSGGKGALNPADLAAQLASAGPETLGGLQIGTRAAIDNSLGTKANDLLALKNELQAGSGQAQAEPSWNQQKLSMLFGPQATADLGESVDRNLTFQQTNNAVQNNSATALRQAAAKQMAPNADVNGIPLINPNMSLTGSLGTAAKRLAQGLLNPLLPDPTQSYGEIARVLTAQGPQRDAYTSALMNTLARRAGNAQTGQSVGNMSALAAALIAGPNANAQLLGHVYQPPAQ